MAKRKTLAEYEAVYAEQTAILDEYPVVVDRLWLGHRRVALAAKVLAELRLGMVDGRSDSELTWKWEQRALGVEA